MSKLGRSTNIAGTITTYTTDAGNASPAGDMLQILGGTNIGTTGALNTVTINLDASVSIAGTLTAGTGITTTAGNVTITAGNLILPDTNAAGTQGTITFGGVRTLHNYGTDNLFVGKNSGNLTLTVATAILNVALGTNALSSITTANRNVAIGYNAMALSSTTVQTVAVGSGALASILGGSGLTAVGYNALNLCTGSGNVALGALAGASLLTGLSNIIIGYAAGSSYVGAESSNICIGHVGVAAESNCLRIGTDGGGAGQQNACYIAGIYAAAVGGVNAAVLIDNAFKLGTAVSSRRFKDNIQDMGDESSPIMSMRPVTFTLKSDDKHTKQFGLIAEEVEPLLPELVLMDKENKPFSVRYHDLPVLLLNEFQKQTATLNKLLGDLCELEAALGV